MRAGIEGAGTISRWRQARIAGAMIPSPLIALPRICTLVPPGVRTPGIRIRQGRGIDHAHGMNTSITGATEVGIDRIRVIPGQGRDRGKRFSSGCSDHDRNQ